MEDNLANTAVCIWHHFGASSDNLFFPDVEVLEVALCKAGEILCALLRQPAEALVPIMEAVDMDSSGVVSEPRPDIPQSTSG